MARSRSSSAGGMFAGPAAAGRRAWPPDPGTASSSRSTSLTSITLGRREDRRGVTTADQGSPPPSPRGGRSGRRSAARPGGCRWSMRDSGRGRQLGEVGAQRRVGGGRCPVDAGLALAARPGTARPPCGRRDGCAARRRGRRARPGRPRAPAAPSWRSHVHAAAPRRIRRRDVSPGVDRCSSGVGACGPGRLARPPCGLGRRRPPRRADGATAAGSGGPTRERPRRQLGTIPGRSRIAAPHLRHMPCHRGCRPTGTSVRVVDRADRLDVGREVALGISRPQP